MSTAASRELTLKDNKCVEALQSALLRSEFSCGSAEQMADTYCRVRSTGNLQNRVKYLELILQIQVFYSIFPSFF